MNRATIALIFLFALPVTVLAAEPAQIPTGGTLPTDPATGRTLNFDFEKGTLEDWKTEGNAFTIVEGDAIAKRRSDMTSNHQGKFWANSFEGRGDGPHGTMTSAPFVISKPFATFLIAGGTHPETYMQIVRADNNATIFQTHGDETETLKPVAADLSKFVGQKVFIRLVDRDSTGWGHVNFDDFRLHDTKPSIPFRVPPPPHDEYAHAGLSPLDAARAMTLPPGFKVTLFAGEPDVVQPISFAIDDKGRLWVAEAYSYPHRVEPEKARDRILIFEDRDGDGKFDTRKVFADRLNLVSGIEVGHGGVFVGAAPEFLFIADKNGDDVPDGPPVVLLDGWGQHDTHETLNSFNWGPDGWLYGCHGVFTHSNVGKPGTPDDKRQPINAGIWRYHPKTNRFEVFAHGTSNPWGIDWDEHGQAFLTSCVIPHLYHVIQGGRYERQAGPHFNPYNYDDIKTIADHRHFVGGNPHAGNGRSDSMGGGHAHSGALILNGPQWPAEYRGSILMNNIHGARLNRDTLRPQGSGFVGSHAKDFLFANDRWSQIVSLKRGPDGSMFMIDWYDKNQCHRVEDGAHDRTNGRIFKVSYGDQKSPNVDIGKIDTRGDVPIRELLDSGNTATFRHILRLVGERGDNPELRRRLDPVAFGAPAARGPGEAATDAEKSPFSDDDRLRALWLIHAGGGLDDTQIAKGLSNSLPYIRAWTVQFVMEGEKPSSQTVARFAEMAKSDPSPVVRLYLASALQRLPLESRWEILSGLVSHAEDASDHNIPLMIWYAAEPLAPLDPARASALASSSKIPTILPFMTRRIAAIGTDAALAMLVAELGRVSRTDQRLALLDGISDALKGRRQVAMPAAWPEIFARLVRDSDGNVRSRSTTLGLNFGDPSALKLLREILGDSSASAEHRSESLAALLKARDPELAATLRSLVARPSPLRGQAIRGLALDDKAETSDVLLKTYHSLSTSEKRDALNTLAARPAFARLLLSAVAEKKIASADISADLVRQMRNLKDDEVKAQIARVWGSVREADANKAQVIARYKEMLTTRSDLPVDAMLGRAVFSKTCAQCHTLFGVGGKVGPELTGSNRADLDYLLVNVLDPNALIGKDYLAHVVATTDGRVLTGIIRGEDKDAITLVTANETLILPRAEIEASKPSDTSMMPDDLWTRLSELEIRSLVLYLSSPSQVPMLATPESASLLFNGRDLSGWLGDRENCVVEGREIVFKGAGKKDQPTQVRSDLAAADFRLTLSVKVSDGGGDPLLYYRAALDSSGEIQGNHISLGSKSHHFQMNSWNQIEIVAKGPNATVTTNGKPLSDSEISSLSRQGIFAILIPPGAETKVHLKDFKLELLKD